MAQKIRTPPRGQQPLVSNQPGQVTAAHNPEAKRATMNIAAVAAQKKAKQHHRELMQELDYGGGGGDFNSESYMNATSSQEHENRGAMLMASLLEKKNSVLTDGSNSNSNGYNASHHNKVKKQVKIKDIVQFKQLPDDDFDSWNDEANNVRFLCFFF
jgi:hypothetical protein